MLSTRVIVLTFYVLSNGLSVDYLNYEFNTNRFMFLPLSPDSNLSYTHDNNIYNINIKTNIINNAEI
jgi:hypothetical protein